jgi:hypothetical protein
VNPAATEVCNGRDDDCDGSTDPDSAPGCEVYYRDEDADGYGDPALSMCLCSPGGGFVAVAGDCADGDVEVHPGAAEVCNGRDDDCDGDTDPEDPTFCATWYRDADQDGWGAVLDWKCLCGAVGQYASKNPGDCDDADPLELPGGTEVCDGHDNDCDGTVDDGASLCPGGACEVGLCQAGVWKDPGTGLVWQRAGSSVALGWAEARSFCAGNQANLPGTGWHLPNISELRTLVRGCANLQTGGACLATETCSACGVATSCLDPSVCRAGCVCKGVGPNNGCYGNPAFDLSCGFHWSSSWVQLASGETMAYALDFGPTYGIFFVNYGADINDYNVAHPMFESEAFRCVRPGK